MVNHGVAEGYRAEAAYMKWGRTMQRQGKILAVDDDPNNIAIL